MPIETIVQYVLYTPHNTNRAILVEMLEELLRENGGSGSGGGPGTPGTPGSNIVYDGGVEQ